MNRPLISIVTVNYKQPEVTLELLRSLNAISYPNLEVILVNNGQKDSILTDHNEWGFEVKEINSEENVGFAGANNLGIDAADGDYLFFLNNDTELSEGVIESVLSCFDSPQIGAVSPILRYFDLPERIQFAGYTKINSWTGRNSLIQSPSDNLSIDSPYFHGAAVMIPRWVINKIGPMPEDYFLYYEELDWSQRVVDAGLKIKVCHKVSVLHKESISTGKNSPLKLYYQTRNRVHFMKRNAKSFIPFLVFFCGVSIPKNLISFSIKRSWAHFRVYLLACKHALVSGRKGWVDAQFLH